MTKVLYNFINTRIMLVFTRIQTKKQLDVSTATAPIISHNMKLHLKSQKSANNTIK